MYKECYISTKDHHYHKLFLNLFYMLFTTMYDMVKSFAYTLLYITVHIFELSPETKWTWSSK